MAATAGKPRSAKAAASEAASVSRATAARKLSSGNASGERAVKGAQARRRAEARSDGGASASESTPSNGRGAARSNGASSSNGRSNSGSGRSQAKSRSSKASSTKGRASSAKNSSSKGGKAGAAKSSSSKGTASRNDSNGKSESGRGKGAAAASSKRAAAPNGKKRSSAAKTQAKRSSATKSQAKRSSPGRSPNDSDHPVAETGKHVASALFKPTQRKKHPIARKVAGTALKKIGQRSLSAGGEAIRSVAENAGSRSRQALRAGVSRIVEDRPPIQASVDVAAPISVVWSEWTSFEWFTEGIHNISDVERDGDELTGQVAAPHERDWRAEIVDERKEQAFAWRSVDGTDCAGLVTFHQLSARLTRVEADLDVLPTNPAETFLLTLPIPTRRAERQLQLFKAHVEFINPDVYESEDKDSGGEQAESDNDGDRETADIDGDHQDAENDD